MKRPLTVTLINALYIVAGITGIAYHATDWTSGEIRSDDVLAFAIRLLAIVGGVFALRGANWARWLLLAWIVYHVFLSFHHDTAETIMHVVITVVTVLCLFNKRAREFFTINN